MLKNQSAPFSIIGGTHTYVSTLLRFEGYPHTPPPASESLGGLGLGNPLAPSSEATNDVDSPHTKAPAPSLIRTLKFNPVDKIFSPNIPISSACLMAVLSVLIARGYSWRTYINP